MNFTTLNVETSKKEENSVCRISIIDYNNTIITNKKVWLVQPPRNEYAKNYKYYTTLNPSDTLNKPSIYDIWEEIENALYNKMIISYYADHTFSCIISSFNYFKNRIQETEKKNPNIKFKNNILNCEFICLSLVLRRLFNNLKTNSLEELCQNVIGSKKIDLNTNDDLKIGFLFNEILKYLNISSFIELKHLAGITLGQVLHRYKTFSKHSPKKLVIQNKKEISQYDEISSLLSDAIDFLKQNKDKTKISMEYQQDYYPCLSITEAEIFRKYDFSDLIRRFQND